jgi:DNA-binding CsgD family transcriptional regulator
VESLTEREKQVASLAANGLSNREIGEELFVQRKTVEFHLGHAYRKLGVRSREALREFFAAADR